MNNWTRVYLLSITCCFSTLAMANHHEKKEGMMMDGESMDALHQNMGMSEEQREEYKMKLKACEKEGRSANECEAKLDRKMDKETMKMGNDTMMKDKEQKGKME